LLIVRDVPHENFDGEVEQDYGLYLIGHERFFKTTDELIVNIAGYLYDMYQVLSFGILGNGDTIESKPM